MIHCHTLLIGLIFGRLLFASSFEKHTAVYVTVCSNDTKIEPSLNDIYQSLIPHDGSKSHSIRLEQLYSELNFFGVNANFTSSVYVANLYAFVRKIGSVDIPLQSLVADGIFEIDLATDLFLSRDILLVQKNFIFLDVLCSYLPLSYEGIRSTICRCFVGENLSSKLYSNFSNKFESFKEDNSDDHKWCVHNPCIDHSSKDGTCQVTVDPFRKSCIIIPILATSNNFLNSDRSAYADRKEHDENKNMENENENINTDNIRPSVSYQLLTHFLTENILGLDFIISRLNQNQNQNQKSKVEQLIDENFLTILIFIDKSLNSITSLIPRYLFNLIFGSFLVLFTEELASSAIFRYILASTFGIFLSFTWLIICIGRISRQMTSIIYFPPICLEYFLSLLFLKYSAWMSMKDIILQFLIDFWSNGAFDVSYIGKLYFLGSIMISLLLTYFTNFLTPDCFSFPIFKIFLRLLGCLLLQKSTSSYEISFFIMILFMNEIHISHFSFELYMHYTVSQSNQRLIARKMTNEEYDSESKTYTKNALLSLKNHFIDNNKHFSNTSSKKSELFEQFLSGQYSGLPDS